MDISILGAGVGGVTTAIALCHKGHKVRIFERTDEPSQIGAGVVLWPNASFVMKKLGLLDRIKEYSGQPTRMQRFDHCGNELGFLDIKLLNHQMDLPSFSIMRTDLQRILLNELSRLGVEVEYQHRVVDIIDVEKGHTKVVFESGLQLQAELIIGADGRMRSVARKYVHADNTPVYQGFINWIGVLESSQAMFSDPYVCDYWGVGERFGIVPVTPYKCYWAGGKASEHIEVSTNSIKDELMATFNYWPEPITQIIEDSDTQSINKIYVHDHDPIDTWHRDNVILIGDSAHAPLPTSGQGACQAMEDAWHLGNALDAYPQDLNQALTHFTQLRRDKTHSITYAARNLANSLFNQDSEYCLQRNKQTRISDYTAMAQGMAKRWGQGLPLG
ncbi:MAG: FAD-dependent monooxygenase [Gammaproteobacteria bacterium]|nr:FAD-dependent monooxygenase [Gammaproteobacteria bacterium]